ncbi:phosphopantetheine-binding protein [Pendulispora brunnea]|uniref:Phosphopantetheine-binding protein n=1 Tax=Pendulispora brunnea TaxID=2905690 RepID=A0ABZ2KR66_9BACT
MNENNLSTISNDAVVLADLGTMIREVIGEEWAEDVPIEMETSFAKDLELESIEFVALAERLKEKFGKGVDFAGWLGSMELEQILQLRVGQLVEFIVRCNSASPTA